MPGLPTKIASWSVDTRRRSDGAIFVEPEMKLGVYPDRLTDRLDYWAHLAPERIFVAEREEKRQWRTIGYREFRRRARGVGQWLLHAGFGKERPIAILSGNGIDHAILALGAMYAGIPYAPISPSYSLISSDFSRLRHVFELLTPGFVFANDGALYERAIDAVMPDDAALIVARNPPRGRYAHEFAAIGAEQRDDGRKSLSHVNSGSVAKILFTSGSTGVPKGVITTHGMLTSNQEMLRTVFPCFAEEPPVICDWLPWNHTFGGSHNFGIALYNGGTMYLDRGLPTERDFEETAANLREIATTVYFNVPKGFEILAAWLRKDAGLRERFFSQLQLMFYAAAGLPQQIWDDMERLAIETRGERIPMLTGLGATETAPFALCANSENRRAGVVGLPAPGVRLKLAPVEGKLEARAKGPNVTPGYWRQPELTRDAFDDEGYYRFGDGLRFVDASDANQGFIYDGRLAEDFKLSTGTWVSVGPLRIHFLLHCAPLARDVVIAGHDRDEVTALVFPDPANYERLRADGGLGPVFQALLRTFAEKYPASSTAIERVIVMEEPPSLDAGELTEKGTVNQRVTLGCRAAFVERLYTQPFAPDVICRQVL